MENSKTACSTCTRRTLAEPQERLCCACAKVENSKDFGANMSSSTVDEEFEHSTRANEPGRSSWEKTALPVIDAIKSEELNIVRNLINKDANEDDLPAYEDFLVLYRKEIKALERSQASSAGQPDVDQTNGQKVIAAKDYKAIIQIAEVLACAGSKCRVCVREDLWKLDVFKSSTDIALNNAIDLSLRLWLMLNVRQNSRTLTPDTVALQWNDDDTLSQFVKQQFPEAEEPMTSNSSHRVDADFTAVSLREYRNIDIKWTTSLEDHLRLKYDRKKKARLRVFPFKRILVDHLRSGNTIYPKALLKEAIWTLDLLFPLGDPETAKFLAGDEGKHLHDVIFWETAPPGFHRYHHWKARLVELHDEFHAPPQTLWRALKDGRNIIVWWTFWLAFAIALMTFVFGGATLWLTALSLKDALGKSKSPGGG